MLVAVVDLPEETINLYLNFKNLLSKYIKLLITLILFGYDGFSQYGYYSDVIKFSHFFNSGSARIKGIGGATTSLGGDVSSISINPAGVGFFNKKVFSISYKSVSYTHLTLPTMS